MNESNVPAGLNKPPADPKPARFQTLADLLRDAYGPKRKRLSLSKADIIAISSASKPRPEELEDLIRLAASDRTLERSRELLLLSVETFAHPRVASEVRGFVREVLLRHPIYQSPPLRGVIDNLPEASSIDAAVAALATQSVAQLQWPECTLLLKKNDLETLRLAAVHCLLIWIRETRGISIDRIQRLLHSACWAQMARRQGSDGKILRTLMLARDQRALGIACSILEELVKTSDRDAASARVAEERARVRADRLQSELDESNSLLVMERSRNHELQEQVKRLRRDHDDEKAHMRNDYEELRGRILHKLRQEVILLDEGLHALRKQPPKIHVMEDHAERAIDGLKAEIEKIKGDVE